jgi:hypothetical protein
MRRQQPGRPPSRTSVFLSATSAPLRFNFGFQTKRGAAEDAEKDAEWKIVGQSSRAISSAVPESIQRTSVFLSATSAPLRFNFGFQTKRGAAEDAEKDAEWKIVGPGFPNIISSDSIPTTIE